MFPKQTVKDTEIQGQTVLVRVDYNVPLGDAGEITDDLRIRASLPTLNYLRQSGAAKIILISHLGRPKGEPKPELSLRPVAERLQQLLTEDAAHPASASSETSEETPGASEAPSVTFVPAVSGPAVEDVVKNTTNGNFVLLENLRFFPGEEADSADFAQSIVASTGATLFVQDGFAVIHRAHTSTSAITKELPSVAGFLVENEVEKLKTVAEAPEKPFVIVLGGAKVEDKHPLIDRLEPLADAIFVGGKIAADGYSSDNPKIHVCTTFADAEKHDIGAPCLEKLLGLVQTAKTVLWNGTLGQAEIPEFAKGSEALADLLGSRSDITSVVCGGDTSGFVENYQKAHENLKFSLISTGGGASLELLSGLPLPGLDCIDDRA